MNTFFERDKIHTILNVFYTRVKGNDVLKDSFQILFLNFEGHVEHITDFWDLTLNSRKKMKNPDNIHFDLVKVHKMWKVDEIELGEWLNIFQKTLNEYAENDPQSRSEIDHWWQITLRLKKFFELNII